MILASERFNASEERLNDVFDFEASAHFSEAEKAALAFAHGATQVPNAVTPEVGARLQAHWDEGQIVEIMGVVALFGYLNRWNDSMGSALEDLPISRGERTAGLGHRLERGQAPMSELADRCARRCAREESRSAGWYFCAPFRPPSGPLSDRVIKTYRGGREPGPCWNNWRAVTMPMPMSCAGPVCAFPRRGSFC